MKQQLKQQSFNRLSEKISSSADRLYRLAYSYVRNEQDALDIVQETAYKALKNQAAIKDDAHIETWLYRVAINSSLDLLRKRARETVGLPETEEGREDDHGGLYVLDLLDKLDEKSRAIVILRFFEDKTLAQIAEILDENQSTVKTRLYKSLRILKTELEGRNNG